MLFDVSIGCGLNDICIYIYICIILKGLFGSACGNQDQGIGFSSVAQLASYVVQLAIWNADTLIVKCSHQYVFEIVELIAMKCLIIILSQLDYAPLRWSYNVPDYEPSVDVAIAAGLVYNLVSIPR